MVQPPCPFLPGVGRHLVNKRNWWSRAPRPYPSPYLLLSLLHIGLWQGPQEAIRVRVGPGLGDREGAHLERSALRAGTAWQGLVFCAGSKEMEKEQGRRGGQTPAAHSLALPPPPRGSRGQCFGGPRQPLHQRLSELKGTPWLTQPPPLTEVKILGSETFSKELKATQHTKAEKEQEQPITGFQPMPIPLRDYSRVLPLPRSFFSCF